MAINRLEALGAMLEQNPADTFARYGLAMELVNTGDLPGAVQHFRTLITNNPTYSAAYFHGGQALEKLGKPEEARELYVRGIEATTKSGDAHTRAELEAALRSLG